MKHFVDQAKITVRAGKGGDGAVSFRREKYVNKGGPDGGDGGRGGNVYLVTDANIATLLDFQSRKLFIGNDGERGGKQKMTGASGEDMDIHVPVGTLVYKQADEKEFVADMHEVGQRTLIAQGGDAGKGNTRFKSSTNRVPRESTPGELGEEIELMLELKLMADVGLIGFPNAGKSTLLSVLTNAKPEIAGYRFTTLIPNLGVLELQGQEIVIADIPGLIDGAADGKGLGDDFLRHVERTKVLVHLIDPTSAAQELGKEVSLDTVKEAYNTIRKELADYSENLLEKPELVVITKTDIRENADIAEQASGEFEKVIAISAVIHDGLDVLNQEIMQLVESADDVSFEPEEVVPVFTLEDLKR